MSTLTGGTRSILEGGIFGKSKIIPVTTINCKADGQEDILPFEFPREFSKPEIKALVGQEIIYIFERSLFDEGALGDLIGEEYTLHVLSGPQTGWNLKEKIVI